MEKGKKEELSPFFPTQTVKLYIVLFSIKDQKYIDCCLLSAHNVPIASVHLDM